MRLGRLLPLLVPAVLALSVPAQGQDFDPHGRRRPRPHPTGPAPGGQHPQPHPGGPAAPPSGPSQEVLVERYTRVVLSQPGAAFPLQRLAQLYRERDGNITKLVADFEQRSAQAGADQYAATVSLAGVYKLDGRVDDAAKTFEKAIALKPGDSTALLALAHLHQDRGDAADARARYEQALPLLTA